jgi:formylmethanofuran dehydrogenase subunit E
MSKQLAEQPAELEALISFHGHFCPGLLIGYRATLLALRRLKVKAAADEELVAIVENNSCSVDAVQFLASCTFGKGNLYYLPYGKQVFTFARRPSGEGIRVSLRKEAGDGLPAEGAERREEFIHRLLSAPDRALFRTRRLVLSLPAPAQVYPSLPCAGCGEPVMETAARLAHGRVLCQPCFEAETSSSLPEEAG